MSAGASPQHHGHIPSYVPHPSNLGSASSHADGNVFASANSSYSDIQDSGSESKGPLKGKNGSTGPADGKAKPHVCATCHRGFTTGGHLQRHQRIHTGIKAYKCPFPGCETRTSRQDNLQQHYRTHLSPTLRRGSGSAARAAVNTAMEAAGLKSTSARIPRKSKGSTNGTNTPSSASAAGSTSHLPSPYQTPSSTGPYPYPYGDFPYSAPLPSVALAQSTSTNSSRVPSPANGGHVHANPNSVQPMPHQPYFHQPFNPSYGYPTSMHQQQYRYAPPPPQPYGMPPHASYMNEHPQQHMYSPMQQGFPTHSRDNSYNVMTSGYAQNQPPQQMQSYPPPRVNTTHDDPYRRPPSPRRRTPDMLSQGLLDPTIMNRPMQQMAPAYSHQQYMYNSYQQAPPMKADNHRNSISSGSDGSGNAASDNSNKQRQ